ncbi:ribonuclease H-like domain-containing protein [Tanacetum coccineum]
MAEVPINLEVDFVMDNKSYALFYGSFIDIQAQCKYHQRIGWASHNKMIQDLLTVDVFTQGTLNWEHSLSLDFKGILIEVMLHLEEEHMVVESLMCDKKNYVLFTDTECLVLSPNFKLFDESQILLKIPRKDMYSFNMKNIVPKDTLTCLNGFFLTTKDETNEILKNFIKEIKNLVDKKVKIIRSDNGIEFKNKVMDDFCKEKGIKREYSVARTPQKNGVAERRNRTLIEASRTMLADSKLPTIFWAKAVSTACYDGDGPDNGNDEQDKSDDVSSPKEVNAAGKHVNTASPNVTTGSFKLNDVSPSVNTASSYDQDIPKDMFTIGASHILEATHIEFFSDEDEP